ncbi:energy transducer TonB [Persephonella sp.]
MDSLVSKPQQYINKRILIISSLIGFILNLLMLGSFQYYLSNIKPVQPIKEPKIKYVKLKEPVKKKKVKKKVLRKQYTKRSEEEKKEIEKLKKKVAVPKASSGKNLANKTVVPAVTPVLPESINLEEKEITLPDPEIDLGEFSEIPAETGEIKEFKAITKGEFNPSFGLELSKFDASAKGTAAGRKLVYKPDPPKIRTTIPPPPVKVKLWVRKDGTVYKVELLGTTGDKKIDQIIKNYVQSWKFNEIKENEVQWAVTTIRFKTTS